MADPPQLERIDEVRQCLADAGRVFVLTGAGISAESGIPTFRGPEGYWKKHPPHELASPEGFARDPKLVWEWYNYRRRLMAACEPNAGHHAVAEIERRVPEFLLCTQNVDGLHRRAGSRQIVEIHGSIWRLRPVDGGPAFEDHRIFEDDDLPVRSEDGRLLRPDVVWFGEFVPTEAFAAVEAFLSGGPVDLALVIGTTVLIHYIQRWVAILQNSARMIVEVNPTPVLPDGWAHARWGKGWAEHLLPDTDLAPPPCP